MAKTAADFRAKHDPATIIGRLEKELDAAHGELGIRDYVANLLGTIDLGRTLPKSVSYTHLTLPTN